MAIYAFSSIQNTLSASATYYDSKLQVINTGSIANLILPDISSSINFQIGGSGDFLFTTASIADLSSSFIDIMTAFPAGGPQPITYEYFQSGSTTVVTQTIDTGQQFLYRKRGYYVAGTAYEYWQTSSPDGSNPSGNPLIDVTVISKTRV